ncbi:octopamine receptor [Caerostris darwini]|uniref:Octopamine receptor n=1 Tax=Caerostris darwini TaxID=1538125 RepID=A0AAV4R262_9ARAC|nr:octopamine receptor [Caerostris darwini]
MPHIIIEASQEMSESPPPFFASEGPSAAPADEDEEDDEFEEEHVTHSIVPRRLPMESSPPSQLPMVAVVLAESTAPRCFQQQVRSAPGFEEEGKKKRGAHSHLAARALPSDAERQKRRLAKARERRATLILGLIMAAFILAWLPFFVLYVLEALCAECHIAPTGFATAFWLGYCNSALNPIIYTIFNRDFRRAFKKILLK